VIHVESEYDYRYNGCGKREKILKMLAHSYFKSGGKEIPFYIKDEKELVNYTTTAEDAKNKVDKRPKTGRIMLNFDIMQKGLTWIIYNQKDLASGNFNLNQQQQQQSQMNN